ncbi:MAG: division/cell wall cluster transcriptional repressor MraZ [Clostridia bacterium]|nr:division/cell wall cluster transcriptional repressor MraZ [Clostridia bacterium]
MIFAGTKEYSVDEKGRVVLPPKYRDDLAGDIMIFKDIVYNCIRVYPYSEYEKYIAELDNEILSDRNAEILLDRAISRAEAVQLDKQGRIMIPQKMRDSVGIDKEVLVIGKRTRFEIWTQAAYDAEFNDDKEAVRAYEDRINTNREIKLRG